MEKEEHVCERTDSDYENCEDCDIIYEDMNTDLLIMEWKESKWLR